MPECEISFDLSRIDFRATSDLLMASYWGGGRSDETHRRAFANSLCVGAYVEGKQVGFGRAITDRTVFAYLADIIVWPQHRGQARLVQALIDHPELGSVSHGACRPATRMGFMKDWDSRHRPMAGTCASIVSRSADQAPLPLLQIYPSAWTRCRFGDCQPWRCDEASL